MRLFRLLATALALAHVFTAAAQGCHAGKGERVPAVVELYTSEGCNSCPPADRWLSSLKGRPEVIPLAFHVDYWDRLGWVDRFASPAHTERQRQLMRWTGKRFIYTPQVVIDGADRQDWPRVVPGPMPRVAQADITIRREGSGFVADLKVAPGTPSLGAYWALTEDGHSSVVRAGENEGSTLKHDAVVLQYELSPLVRPDAAGGARLSFRPRVALQAAYSPRVVLVLFDPVEGKPVQALACPELSISNLLRPVPAAAMAG